jgi:AcrR family transcriptional regulator
MSHPPRTQEQRTAATRLALLAAARELLATRSFSDIPASDIVARAGVTRGALYHHYPAGKPDLFRDLLVQMQEVLEHAIVGAARKCLQSGGDPITSFLTGARVYLDAMQDPVLARIMVLDGPVVLGWEAWFDIDAVYGVRQIVSGIELLRELDLTVDVPIDMFSRMFYAANVEATRTMLFSNTPETVKEEILTVLSRFLLSIIRPEHVHPDGTVRWDPDTLSCLSHRANGANAS